MLKKPILIYVCLSTLASAVNYITYPVLAHLLPANAFVNTTVALSLLTQMSTFLSSVVAISIGLAKERRPTDTEDKVELLQSSLFRLFALVVLAFVIISPWIMPIFKVPTIFALPIGLLMLISVPIAVISGFLNGHGKMVKLGITTCLSASLQFTLATIVALLTASGLYAMLSMAVSQVLTVSVIYYIFRKEGLPRFSQALKPTGRTSDRKFAANLLLYTFVSALAIMAINIAQIADLLTIKAAGISGVKFYTDIYVLSRIVFFGGLIFIWPFLAEIDIRNHNSNYRPLAKVSAYFVLISCGALLSLYLFGPAITHILFGGHYAMSQVRLIGALSIVYKLAFLFITAIVLYFTVLRSYKAVWLTGSIALVVLLYSSTVRPGQSIQGVLVGLDVIALLGAVVSFGLFSWHRPPKESVNPRTHYGLSSSNRSAR